MKQNVALNVLGAGLLCVAPLVAQKTSNSAATTHSVPDAKRLRTGTFTYHDLDHGKEVGQGTISVRHLARSGNYDFVAKSTFATDFQGFSSQQWEVVATFRFEPVSARLAFVRDSQITPVFDLAYSSGRVSGYLLKRKGSGQGTKQNVDASVPPNTVDQRIDWAAVLATNLETGQRFEFNVYDPGTGVSLVEGQVRDLEQIKVPAGTFRAYRIVYQMEKSGRTEHYQMFASQESPHVMIREEFPNGVISELVQVSKSARRH